MHDFELMSSGEKEALRNALNASVSMAKTRAEAAGVDGLAFPQDFARVVAESDLEVIITRMAQAAIAQVATGMVSPLVVYPHLMRAVAYAALEAGKAYQEGLSMEAWVGRSDRKRARKVAKEAKGEVVTNRKPRRAA